jgi:hypothetical protein
VTVSAIASSIRIQFRHDPASLRASAAGGFDNTTR